MSQQAPASASWSIPTTPPPAPRELSSMPTTHSQLSDVDAVSTKKTRDINAVSHRSASPSKENGNQPSGYFKHGKYPPHESRAQRSLTYKLESTPMKSPDSTDADHIKECSGPEEKEKLKPYIMTVDQSLKSKIPEFSHDPCHMEEERQVAKPLDTHYSGHMEEESKDREWIITIKEKLDIATRDNEACMWAKLCIYRIPPQLRDADDEDTYLPQIVTLGPYYHHKTKRVKDMESHKWRALQCMLKRTKNPIEYYLNGVKELEESARACYQGRIVLNSNQFVEMMVLDSCFILDIFRGFANGFTELGYTEDDPVFAMRATMHLIQGDMVMLENQIPLFVLDRILGLQNGDPNQKGIVSKLAIKFFEPLTPTDELKTARTKMNCDSFVDGLHCLEVFRRYLLDIPTLPNHTASIWENQAQTNPVVDKRRQLMVHCAIELKEAGIKFKRSKTDKFWKIKYKKGVLKIPRLLIHGGTKSLLMNLIAYERCHISCTTEVTEYVIFMDNLIGTAADVSLLHRRGIIEHWLGNDEEVAELFTQLNRSCQEVVFGIHDNYLSSVAEKVNKYYNGRWNNWVANLNHTYFTNPWTTISLLAAGALLWLTLTQTFYAVYGYYRPN